MTPLKLAAIGIGIASVVAGALIVSHNAAAGATLTGVGGHLIGWAFPELGPKADS